MDAWWFRIAYLVLFIVFFFVFRFLFNRWKRQALEEQAALHNLQLAHQRDSDDRSRHLAIVAVDEPPPEFEVAVKYSKPVSYIELDSALPSYEDSLRLQNSNSDENHYGDFGDHAKPTCEAELSDPTKKLRLKTEYCGELKINHM